MDLLEILQNATFGDVMLFLGPVWVSVLVGVLVGWVWKPKWAANLGVSDKEILKKSNELPKESFFMQLQLPSCVSWVTEYAFERNDSAASSSTAISDTKMSSLELPKEKSGLVTEEDLKYLSQLVEETDGGPDWIQMMDRSSPSMSYQAWRRDIKNGPPQYRSRTCFEDATPEMVRDFFWDDEFRMKWDEMLVNAETLEESATTGTMMVKWVRKFPFFCSDREYIIGRRIWDAERSYYCVTKGVPCSSVPRQNKPRRVDLYYSSWCIRQVESKRDGQLTACEVMLVHYEDMGIPWEIAKLGVKQGMWGAVKKIEPGLRAYQKDRVSGAPLSHCASMAQINTKVSADLLRYSEGSKTSELDAINPPEKTCGRGIPKFLFVGGAIALACTIDRGLLSKAVICGVARRFGNIGRRL
ncbi:hypothetical protein LIER_31671 [Lithospermum erythrorhizon]|uniref:START domain-containing protein n=1 Tax=Lithospermum erythrorhizon TaxID=34254 RepID=A0AAV3RRP0_LITER